MPRMAINPLLAIAVLAGVTTVDLAYNNGPSSSTAQPPAMYDVLQPDTRNATIAILKSKVVADATRRDRIELAGLGFHWPNASLTHSLENTLGYNPLRLALYSEATGAEDHVACPTAQVRPAVPVLSLDAGQPAGPALHRHRRAHRDHGPRLKPGDLRLVARTTDGYIYENPDAFPRVLFATEARTPTSPACWPMAPGPTPICAPPCCSSARLRRAPPPPAAPAAHASQLPQHRGNPRSRQPRRRMARPQRPLAPLVVRRGGRQAGGICAPTSSFARSRSLPADTVRSPVQAACRSQGAAGKMIAFPRSGLDNSPPLDGEGSTRQQRTSRSSAKVGTSAGSLQIKSPAPKCDVGMKPQILLY